MVASAASKRKSCADCVKAKRKCGMELPKCKRCAKKNIVCSYPYTVDLIDSMTFPELEFSWLDDLMQSPNMLPWAGALQPQLDVASNNISSGSSTSGVYSGTSGLQNEPDYLAVNERPTKSTMGRPETEASLRIFKTWPEKWVNEGKAPFIHPKLYASEMPRPLQDAYASCAIYSTKTDQNAFVAFTVIESKANDLVRSPNQSYWTPLDLLAAVQALLIFQFIRLFDGDIRQRALAEKAAPLLDSWTEQLSARTVDEQNFTTYTAPSWRSWIFAESVRRTITMSIFLSGVYSLVKLGFCTQGDNVAANSFTAQRRLWEAQNSLEWERVKQLHNAHWVQNMNFDGVLQDGDFDELDDYGIVLMIAVKGRSMVDHWMVTAQPERRLVSDLDFHRSLVDAVQAEHHDIGSASTLT